MIKPQAAQVADPVTETSPARKLHQVGLVVVVLTLERELRSSLMSRQANRNQLRMWLLFDLNIRLGMRFLPQILCSIKLPQDCNSLVYICAEDQKLFGIRNLRDIL